MAGGDAGIHSSFCVDENNRLRFWVLGEDLLERALFFRSVNPHDGLFDEIGGFSG